MDAKIENEEKIDKAGKPKVKLAHPVEDNEKSKELEKAFFLRITVYEVVYEYFGISALHEKKKPYTDV